MSGDLRGGGRQLGELKRREVIRRKETVACNKHRCLMRSELSHIRAVLG